METESGLLVLPKILDFLTSNEMDILKAMCRAINGIVEEYKQQWRNELLTIAQIYKIKIFKQHDEKDLDRFYNYFISNFINC